MIATSAPRHGVPPTSNQRLIRLVILLAVIAGLVGMHQLSMHHRLIVATSDSPSTAVDHHRPLVAHSDQSGSTSPAIKQEVPDHQPNVGAEAGQDDTCLSCHTGSAMTCLAALVLVLVALGRRPAGSQIPLLVEFASHRASTTGVENTRRTSLTITELSILRT